MHRFTLFVVAVTLLTSSMTQAASYQKTDGTVVDPVMDMFGSPHSYSGINLESHANLSNTNLTSADLRGAHLSNADMNRANLDRANLASADLHGTYMKHARLSGADLTEVNLTEASMHEVYLTEADLHNANLSNANMTGVNLIWADLSDANLRGAHLYRAYLANADLYGADLHDAFLDTVTFSPGTTLYDGQTVAQHGFDAASLQTYLEASPVSVRSAKNLTLVPEPASVFLLLTGLLTLACVRF